jgi:hypothetical protein
MRPKSIPFTCETCSAPFLRYPSEVRKAQVRGYAIRFCSKACEPAARRHGNPVDRTCERCGTTFVVQPGTIRHAEKSGVAWGRFCSAACRDTTNATRQRTGRMIPCATCGTPVWRRPAVIYRHTFCSPRCRHAAVHTWNHPGGWGIGGIRPDLGHYVRSRWEANVCRVLGALGFCYDYEPRTFACGDRSYTPDLWVPAWHAWVEIKGVMDGAARERIEAFRATHPGERLIVIDITVYRALEAEWRERLPLWESL